MREIGSSFIIKIFQTTKKSLLKLSECKTRRGINNFCIVLLKELPEHIKNSIEAYIGCLSDAIMRDEYTKP